MKALYGKNPSAAKIDNAAALVIFCIFTVLVLAVLALGVSAYKNMTDISLEIYDERVCLSYMWTKVKNGDDAGKVYMVGFHGLPALCIEEVYEDIKYITLIYHYDGWVYELFFEDGLEFYPEEGVPVIRNKSLSFERFEDGLIKVSVGSESVFISPRGKTGIAFAGGGL
ncbi:MAG: DUF4860 domain-containing protein [Synergistaceae bacterium]|nr:DUF4860 domain-containing protein [Synergistaceae bacterium]